MCLIVEKNTEEKIAEEDIICYKRIDKYSTTKGIKLVSPFQFFEYKLNKLYRTTFIPRELKSKIGYESGVFYATCEASNYYSTFPYYLLKVYQKGFHSYKNIPDEPSFKSECIVKCIIPAGTKYIEDKTGLICSEAIKIIEIL